LLAAARTFIALNPTNISVFQRDFRAAVKALFLFIRFIWVKANANKAFSHFYH
jgi:hypothetical protein